MDSSITLLSFKGKRVVEKARQCVLVKNLIYFSLLGNFDELIIKRDEGKAAKCAKHLAAEKIGSFIKMGWLKCWRPSQHFIRFFVFDAF